MLQANSGTLNPVEVVCDLGLLLDTKLSIKQYVTQIVSNCFYQLHQLWLIRCIFGKEVTSQLISAFVLSWLDYCNSLFSYLPHTTTTCTECCCPFNAQSWLQWSCDTIISAANASRVYWCTKSTLDMHHSIWLTMQSVAESRHRPSLRSANTVKRCTHTKFGEQCFSHAGPGPAAWNSLHDGIKLTTDTNMFLSLLKSHLFHLAFWHIVNNL